LKEEEEGDVETQRTQRKINPGGRSWGAFDPQSPPFERQACGTLKIIGCSLETEAVY
jgi:hypothetical protein